MVLFKRRKSTKGGFRKKRTSKRKRTFKRKSYKRMSHMRKKRRFPVARITSKFTVFPKHREDRIRMKMSSTCHYQCLPATLTVVNPGTNYSFGVFFPSNQIISTTSTVAANPLQTGMTSSSFNWAPPQGTTEMFDSYVYSQVRGTRMHFNITANETGGTWPCTIFGACVPLTFLQYSNLNPLTTSFDQIQLQPKARKFSIYRTADQLATGRCGSANVTMFDSPHKMQATPLYYSQTAASAGTDTTTPTDQLFYALFFCITGLAGSELPAGTSISIVATVSHSVEFFQRGVVSLSAPPPMLPGIDIEKDEDEKDMDSLPEFKTLSVTEPPTPRLEEKKESKEEKKISTCLNPAHPSVPHTTVGTCL